MQAYGPGFARVYNAKWSAFAKQVAPRIIAFYEETPIGREKRSVLDLCCGTGHLSVAFLERGYSLVGIDLSGSMIGYAEDNAAEYVKSESARFVVADASDFKLDRKFGLVVSTYDSLNHLEDEEALVHCFRCVRKVCCGYFVFDLNTRSGLRRWNNVTIDESGEDALIITRGMFDGRSDKAWMQITGFVETSKGNYERFEETVFNTVFKLDRVREALLEVGWKQVYFARITDLGTPIDNPETEGRVFVVAQK